MMTNSDLPDFRPGDVLGRGRYGTTTSERSSDNWKPCGRSFDVRLEGTLPPLHVDCDGRPPVLSKDPLTAIGIKSHATIATYLPDDPTIDAVLNKIKAGVKVGAMEFKLGDDADEAAVKAQWMVLTRTANQSYLASITSSTPASPTGATTTATGSGADKDSVPKTLPASVYTRHSSRTTIRSRLTVTDDSSRRNN